MYNATPNVPPYPPPPGAQQKSWLPKVLIGCGALLVLAVIGIGVFVFIIYKATAGPEQTVQSFLAAAEAGNYAAAHDYFSAPLKNVQPLDVFIESAQANADMFQVADTTFNNRSVDMNGAELSGSVTLKSGTQVPAQFKLVKEDGEWRLISYSIGR